MPQTIEFHQMNLLNGPTILSKGRPVLFGPFSLICPYARFFKLIPFTLEYEFNLLNISLSLNLLVII